MRIAMVTQAYYPSNGGISEVVHHTTTELRRLGHEVDVITSRFRGHRSSSPGVHRLGRNIDVPHFGGFANICAGWNLKGEMDRLYAAREFDLVHVHQPLCLTLPLAAVDRIPADVPLVGTFHAAGARSRLYRVFQKRLQWRFDRIDARVAVSHAAQAFVGRYFDGDFQLVPNGVDPNRFHPRHAGLDGLESDRPTLLFVGRFYRRKGLPVLLRALPSILERVPDARLLVVGDGPAAPAYRHQAARFGDSVRFLGELPRDEIPRAYRTADVFVAPSTERESFGVIHLEAMASATPIVASDIPGYRELLDPGREALLFPNRSESELADAVVRVLQDGELRRSMAAAGRAKAEHYAWSGIARRLEEIYYDLVDRRAVERPIRLAS